MASPPSSVPLMRACSLFLPLSIPPVPASLCRSHYDGVCMVVCSACGVIEVGYGVGLRRCEMVFGSTKRKAKRQTKRAATTRQTDDDALPASCALHCGHSHCPATAIE